jgi:hypothetical protein
MSALSRELGVSLSALTQIADRLERVRLVKRVTEANDRRVRCLQLTARGEKIMRKRREARVLRTLAVLEQLPGDQREAVRASLQILVDACSAVYSRAENAITGKSRPGQARPERTAAAKIGPAKIGPARTGTENTGTEKMSASKNGTVKAPAENVVVTTKAANGHVNNQDLNT